MRKQNGITLIALVITIIVMLILVAVTISMAVSGGLFEKAGEATNSTRSNIEAESKIGEGKITVQGSDLTGEHDMQEVADYYINGTI